MGVMRSLIQSVTWLLLMGTLGYGARLEAAQGKGVVTAERVNLRTRASLYDSQAFAKVNTGDSLVILEQIEVNSPSSEGPSQWLRVSVPKEILLWISSKYVDKPSGSVTVNRLNIRVGPGVEHQVIGQLMQGDVITPVKEAGDWVGIEPPEQAVAYIASQFVELQTPEEVVQETPAELPAENSELSPDSETPLLIVDDPQGDGSQVLQATVSGNQPDESPATGQDPSNLTPSVSENRPEEALTQDNLPESTQQENPPVTENADAVAPAPVVGEELTSEDDKILSERLKRIVTREGIVKRSRSIQAPTYHRLEDPTTHRTMNYLYTGKLHLNRDPKASDLKPYEQFRIRVTGQESVDPEWPSIPVIEIETLRLVD